MISSILCNYGHKPLLITVTNIYTDSVSQLYFLNRKSKQIATPIQIYSCTHWYRKQTHKTTEVCVSTLLLLHFTELFDNIEVWIEYGYKIDNPSTKPTRMTYLYPLLELRLLFRCALWLRWTQGASNFLTMIN